MNIALFYQLRERLCAAAVSGCDVISEDFRLKRAVEDFEPLAKANKVFAKLYAMCGELLTNGKPSVLADCIALCDALAVTQGTYKDNSETSENIGVSDCEPSETRYSSLKNDFTIQSRDPRVIYSYLSNLKANTPELTKEFILNYGREIVPALKQRIDLNNPKEHGMIVEMVGQLAGADENDWYLSLVDNENAPQAVRVHAVSCLGYDKSNADRLLELYKTEKAVIKDSAALALVQLDVPESEVVLNKVTTGKFVKKNVEIISVSRNKIAVDYAVDYAEKWLEQEKSKSKKIAYDYDLAVRMLANKTGIEDILDKIAEYNGENILNIQLMEMIVTNLGRHKDEEYRVLIENLYKRNPKYFTMPYLLMIMAEDRGVAITDLPELVEKYRMNLLMPLYQIKYNSMRNCYMLAPQFANYRAYEDKLVRYIPMEDGRFEKILELISDTSYMKKSLLKLRLQNRRYCGYTMRKEKGDVYTDDCIFMAYRIFGYLYLNASPDDVSRIRSLEIDFCKEAMKYFPRDQIFKSLCKYDVQYIRDNPDLLEDMMMFRIKNFDTIIRDGYFDEIPKDVLDVIIPKIYRKLKKLKTVSINRETVASQLRCVERFMIHNGYDREKILKGNE